MFFTNHRSNTEAGFSVSTDLNRDGLLRVSVSKDQDTEFDWIDFSDDVIGMSAVEKGIEWAMDRNYIVAL